METLEKVIVALEVNPVDVLDSGVMKTLEERFDKKKIMQALTSLEAGRQVEEVK